MRPRGLVLVFLGVVFVSVMALWPLRWAVSSVEGLALSGLQVVTCDLKG